MLRISRSAFFARKLVSRRAALSAWRSVSQSSKSEILRALKEGFAVVDQRGNVYRIDQRTTGDLRAEIDKRLGGIDRTKLMSVAAAREIRREANKAAWRTEQEQRRAVMRMNKPLGKTAGEIRMAWTLTKTAAAHVRAYSRCHFVIVAQRIERLRRLLP